MGPHHVHIANATDSTMGSFPELGAISVSLRMLPILMLPMAIFFRMYSGRSLVFALCLSVTPGAVNIFVLGTDHGEFSGHACQGYLYSYMAVQMLNTHDGLIHLPRRVAAVSLLALGPIIFEVRQLTRFWHGSSIAHLMIWCLLISFAASATLGHHSPLYEWRKLHDPMVACAVGALLSNHVHDPRPHAIAMHTIQGRSLYLMGAAMFAISFASRQEEAYGTSVFAALSKLLCCIWMFNAWFLVAQSICLYFVTHGGFYGLHDVFYHEPEKAEEAATIYCCITAWLSIISACICSLSPSRWHVGQIEYKPVSAHQGCKAAPEGDDTLCMS